MKKKNNYRELLIMKNEKFDKKIKEMQDNLQIKGKIYFYIRVSSNDQLEDGQFLKAKEFCEKNNIDINDESIVKIYHEKVTGTKKDREQLQAMLKAIGQDDLLVLYKLDRLSRNYKDCVAIWEEILDKGADIHIITQPLLDTRMFPKDDLFGYLMNQLMLNMYAYFAQFETEQRAERAKAGVKAMPISEQMTQPYINKDGELVESHAKKISSRTNKPLGRPNLKYPKEWERTIVQQQNKEISMQEALDRLKMKKASYYKLIKQYEAENNVEILKKRKNKTL